MNLQNSKNIIPGFKITLSFTLIYLLIIVIIPLSGLFFVTAKLSFSEFIANVTEPQVVAAYKVSFYSSFVAAIVSGIFGLIIAWVLAKYDFYGKKALDYLVDLPFAIPTAVSGITLAALYAKNGWIGSIFDKFGIEIAFTQTGIIIALIFVGFPFVVRTVEPILKDLDNELEEASASLGSGKIQTFFKVTLPIIFPALLTGITTSFARALGEYGSVIFIAGNMPMMTEIVPLVIITKLEQYDYDGATSIALLMLLISFTMLLVINYMQKLTHRR
ncbi:sulfate ABC transporter permease subunit CysT [Rickettsiales bacterium]|nr:sulfate ABC transporter permease subunit CysT [Rickettsiales bacterium]